MSYSKCLCVWFSVQNIVSRLYGIQDRDGAIVFVSLAGTGRFFFLTLGRAGFALFTCRDGLVCFFSRARRDGPVMAVFH